MPFLRSLHHPVSEPVSEVSAWRALDQSWGSPRWISTAFKRAFPFAQRRPKIYMGISPQSFALANALSGYPACNRSCFAAERARRQHLSSGAKSGSSPGRDKFTRQVRCILSVTATNLPFAIRRRRGAGWRRRGHDPACRRGRARQTARQWLHRPHPARRYRRRRMAGSA